MIGLTRNRILFGRPHLVKAGMTEVVNLRTVRKRARRAQEDSAAAANRLAHGTPKHERQRAETQRDKSSRDLEAHRIDKGDGR